MDARPLVSVITIFLNEAEFLGEAVCSVLAQTYENWELILVDDGSTDASTGLAKKFALDHPDRIRYVEHPQHANLGMSSSRNLGLKCARGEFLAFLDADDVWLEHKLAKQVPRLLDQPDLGMTYGVTQYWHSWTGKLEDVSLDHLWRPGVITPTTYQPPDLLTDFLKDKIRMPCMGGILARKSAVDLVGGWESSFRGLYEDQVFFARLCLAVPIELTDEWLDRYRQHPESACAVGEANGELPEARRVFFQWLAAELERRKLVGDENWATVQRIVAECSLR